MYGVIGLEFIKGSGRILAPRRPWVARLTGLDATYGFARSFVRPTHDYTHARKSGARGIYLYFAMPPGIYEVFEVLSWKHDRRYFIRVEESGDWHEIKESEVRACLTNDSSASTS